MIGAATCPTLRIASKNSDGFPRNEFTKIAVTLTAIAQTGKISRGATPATPYAGFVFWLLYQAFSDIEPDRFNAHADALGHYTDGVSDFLGERVDVIMAGDLRKL